jgi:hypothetical protein
MESILKKIPQSVIEMYSIQESGNSISLYSNPKLLVGYISLPTNDLIIDESQSCIHLKILDKKVFLSLYKEVQATHMCVFF